MCGIVTQFSRNGRGYFTMTSLFVLQDLYRL